MIDKSNYEIYDSPYGKLKICYTERVISYIKLLEEDECYKMGKSSNISELAKKQLDEYFAGERKVFDLPITFNGTDFQKKVWRALCEIPYGETRSYKEIAITIGNEKACRAVGMANNKNPITIIVPCHRVIGSNSKLVGYAGGLDMKKGLLELEKNNK